jgi:arsenate reductase (thioredoxin)
VSEENTRRASTRVLILCTGNSARSQMAEGWLRYLGGEAFLVASAGTKPAERVNPLAALAMAEVGIDIAVHFPKHLERFIAEPWDYVFTVCDNANESCPIFPGAGRRVHRSFDDPAAAVGTEAERLAEFRRVRDEIRDWLSAIAAEVRAAGT